MSLQYRFIGRDRREDVHTAASRAMTTWLHDKKGIRSDLTVTGRRIEMAGKEVSVTRASAENLAVARYALYEEGAGGRWATILTAISAVEESWLWVDVEWVSEDPWGRTPSIHPPALVQYLLLDETVHLDGVVLPPSCLTSTTAGHGNALAAEVLRPDRHTPIVVVSPDPAVDVSENEVRGRSIARALLGIAPVYVLSDNAAKAFNDSLPRDMQVYGGAVRTYLPVSGLSGLPAIKRHRVLGPTALRSRLTRAVDIIAAPLRVRAISARPPEIYRERGRELLQESHGQGTDELLLADALAAEAASAAAKAAATELSEQLEWQALEMEETLSELERAEARVRFLTAELAKKEVHLAANATPDSFSAPDVSTFDEVLEAARKRLKFVQLGSTDDDANSLDGYPQAPSWAKKSWRALAALDAYARARSLGEQRDFVNWCEAGEDPTGIPATWVMPVESDSVNNNPRYRGARTFEVPRKVNSDGEVYMPAHIKIVQGGRPAPRIHYHDDSSGPSGKVWVGYIGPHLPNDQTN